MKYFHRTHLAPETVIEKASAFFGPRLAPAEETSMGRRFSGTIGQIGLHVTPEGGHYTLVTIETNQPGESEADRLAKRFLTLIHSLADPGHVVRGAY